MASGGGDPSTGDGEAFSPGTAGCLTRALSLIFSFGCLSRGWGGFRCLVLPCTPTPVVPFSE